MAAALVFDNSLRMQYEQDDKTRLAKAKELAGWLVSQLPAECLRAGPQFGIGELFQLGLECVDLVCGRPVRLDFAIVGRSENLGCKCAERQHFTKFLSRYELSWQP